MDRCFFCEEQVRSVQWQVAVNFVCGNLVVSLDAVFAASVHKHSCAFDICFEEDGKAKPIATIPGMFRNTISLFGLSKSYGMASLRAGFVVADEIIIRELINRIFQGMDSAPDIVGRALAGAFNVSPERDKIYKEYFGELRKIYKNIQ